MKWSELALAEELLAKRLVYISFSVSRSLSCLFFLVCYSHSLYLVFNWLSFSAGSKQLIISTSNPPVEIEQR